MFCTSCGKQIKDNSPFCPYCGAQQASAKNREIKVTEETIREEAAHTGKLPVKEQEIRTERPAERRKGLPGWAMMLIGFALSAALFTGLIFGGVFNSGGTGSSAAKLEGKGYDTPEEAIIAYAEALKTQDYDRLLSTFAVESYCENYDTLKYMERVMTYNATLSQTNPVAPTENDLMARTNIERRRAFVLNRFNLQLLALANASSGGNLDDLIEYNPVKFEQGSEGEREMARLLEDMQDLPDLSKLEIGEILYGETVNENYLRFVNLRNTKNLADICGADGYKSLALSFSVDGLEGILFMDTARYNGKWYNVNPSGVIGGMAGLSTGGSGLVITSDRGEFSEFRDMIANQEQTLKELKTYLPEIKEEWEEDSEITMSFDEMLDFFALTELTD